MSRAHYLVVCVAVAALVAAGCDRQPSFDDPAASGPPDTSGFQPAVAQDLEAAWERVLAAPTDIEASGDLAMRFHAYGSFDEAARWYERTRRLEPEAFRWAYYEALVRARNGQNDAALALFDAALGLEPEHVGAALKRALVLADLGRNDDAVVALERLAEQHPANTLVLFELGRLQLAGGDAEAAIGTLTRALYVGGNFAEGHAQLAAAYAQVGNDDGAAGEETLYRLHRQHVIAGRNLPPPEILALDVTRPGPREAPLVEQMLERGVNELEVRTEAHPDDLRWQKSLIGVYGRLGRVDDAERRYETLTGRSLADAELHTTMGNLRLLENRNAAAAEAFEAAVDLEPGNARAHMQLGQALERLGRGDAAREEYAQAVALAESDPVARSLLGRRLALDGDAPAALEQLAAMGDAAGAQPWSLYAEAVVALQGGDEAAGDALLQRAGAAAEQTGDIELAWIVQEALAGRGDQS